MTELNFEGKVEEVNEMLQVTQFMPICDEANPGIQNIVLSAFAWGSSSGVKTAVKMQPEGNFQKVVGTNEQRFYFASHQQNVFVNDDKIPIYGRVQDMTNKNIFSKKDDLYVTIEQTYGQSQCSRSDTIPV